MRRKRVEISSFSVCFDACNEENMLGWCSSRAMGSGRSDSEYCEREEMSSGVEKTVERS